MILHDLTYFSHLLCFKSPRLHLAVLPVVQVEHGLDQWKDLATTFGVDLILTAHRHIQEAPRLPSAVSRVAVAPSFKVPLFTVQSALWPLQGSERFNTSIWMCCQLPMRCQCVASVLSVAGARTR